MNMRSGLPVLLLLAISAAVAELRAPAQVTAGSAFSLASSGSGKGTLYLAGPGQTSKRSVALGGEIPIHAEEVEHAGRYTAVVCDGGNCTATHFYVRAAEPAKVSLLVHPSRVKVAQPNAISAVALAFDKFGNLELSPAQVEFKAIPKQGPAMSQTRPTQNGVTWIRLTSATKEGPAKIRASLDKVSELRVVQQVASDACNLRIKPEWSAGKFFVETEPVRDCSGNSVPDGTVVSFTKVDASGKTTVDAPIKRGIARVQMPVKGSAKILVASGVVTGNELAVEGRQ
jgi:hypothetical protein